LKSYELFSFPFKRLPAISIFTLYSDINDITWMGGTEGLISYNGSITKNYNIQFKSLIRNVIIKGDSSIFNGTYFDHADSNMIQLTQPLFMKPLIKYSLNDIRFKFAAPFFENEDATTFSYYLPPFDKHWSKWSRNAEKEYTNLPEGNYKFYVKAKNIYEVESEVTCYSFTVLPPWYRTWLAYLLYLLFFIGLVTLITKLYTRRLQTAKIRLEKIVEERTAEVVKQKNEIEEKNKEITASINYASRIQSAILPTVEVMNNEVFNYFILLKPRDIVSGDFYWMKQLQHFSIIVAADCTGHGVPGAFMSLLGSAFLNEIVEQMDKELFSANQYSCTSINAATILDSLRKKLKISLHQTGKIGETKDGMDLGLCVLNNNTKELQYAGAHSPLYIIRKTSLPKIDIEKFLFNDVFTLMQIEADSMPIGIHYQEKPFTNNTIQLYEGDLLFMFSDGFMDQFGGADGKKYLSKRFKQFILSIAHQQLSKQKQLLIDEFEKWKGTEHPQVDDVLIIGLQII